MALLTLSGCGTVDSDTTTSADLESTELSLVASHYTLPGGGREAMIDIVVQVLDDNGYTVREALRVNVS
jgi:hypothetical protein